MRVIEPNANANKFVKNNKLAKRKTTMVIIFAIVMIALLSIFIALFVRNSKTVAPIKDNIALNNPQNITNNDQIKPGKIGTFTSQEFYDLYNNFSYPNTRLIAEDSKITGNLSADKRIRKLAKDRGYRIRTAPVSDTFVEVAPGMLLQQRAAEAWQDLAKKAKKDDIIVSVTAGYRSANDQKAIFLSRLAKVNLESIASDRSDNFVNSVLITTAPPGYSRHHNGYTVDIGCENNPSVRFENSSCFTWLSKNNYYNAKQVGWIPSYPSGGEQLQGPEPESWEYVWVGVDALYK